MRRPPPLVAAQFWGVACGAIFGALRTREAALHLLAKNESLDALGTPALPGAGHWEVMASWAPAGAGALFFGLSLGLGWGTLFGLWFKATGVIPGRACRWTPWAGLAIPLWALTSGDPGLAVMLTIVFAGAFAASSRAATKLSWERLVLSAVCLGLLALGSLTWARAPGGPFTHLRDRFLFNSTPGLAFQTFYYRWTLYPAEILKPLRVKRQPTVALPPEIAPARARGFCRSVSELGALCLPHGNPGADASLERSEGGWEIAAGGARTAWPKSNKERRAAWETLSGLADPSRALRSFTAWALAGGFLTTAGPPSLKYLSILLGGCPLAILWGFAAGSLVLGKRMSRRWQRILASTLCAGSLAAGLAWAGLPDAALQETKATLASEPPPTAETLARLFDSPQPAVRFYAIRAAYRLGDQAESLLVEALSDPVMNVRYAAAEALGRVGGERAKTVLLRMLESREDWYVKERAYAALWRLGWRPR